MAKVEYLTNETKTHGVYYFYCPGCKHNHGFDNRWSFNGDYEKPTFSPSLLCNKDYPTLRCHSFVKDGSIQFLNDCYHELAGKTVPLEDID